MNVNNNNINMPDQSAVSSSIMPSDTGNKMEATKDFAFTPASNTSAQASNFVAPNSLGDSLKNILAQLQSLLSSSLASAAPATTNNVDEVYKIDLPASNMTSSAPQFAPSAQSSIFGEPESPDTIGIHIGNDAFVTDEDLTMNGNDRAIRGTTFNVDEAATNSRDVNRSTPNFTRAEKFTRREWRTDEDDTITFKGNYNIGDVDSGTAVFQIKESGSAPPAVVARLRADNDSNGNLRGWRLVLESPHFETNPEFPIRMDEDGTPRPFKLEAKSTPPENGGNRRGFEITVGDTTFTGEHPNADNEITFRWGLYSNSRTNGDGTISGVEIAEE